MAPAAQEAPPIRRSGEPVARARPATRGSGVSELPGRRQAGRAWPGWARARPPAARSARAARQVEPEGASCSAAPRALGDWAALVRQGRPPLVPAASRQAEVEVVWQAGAPRASRPSLVLPGDGARRFWEDTFGENLKRALRNCRRSVKMSPLCRSENLSPPVVKPISMQGARSSDRYGAHRGLLGLSWPCLVSVR